MVHLVVPIIGIAAFIELRRRMLLTKIERPPINSFFIILAHYGALLILILTTMFWYWSGMASLGLAYLLFLSPPVMVVIAAINFGDRKLSLYHRTSFISAAVFPVISISLILILIFAVKTLN